MPITPRVRNNGANQCPASGNRNRPKRRNPYVPSFSITPARITEPAVGASGVRVGQPGVDREDRDLDGERDREGGEQPPRGIRADRLRLGDLNEVEREYAGLCLVQERSRDDADEHECRPGHGEQEELEGRVDAVVVPQPPIRKYIGTRTISKNTKKRKRSSARNEPRRPASSNSIHAVYGFSSWCASAPSSAIGNSTPVSTSRNSEMPSTPTNHEIPQLPIHSCCDTNWKPDSAVSKLASR